MPQGGRKPWSAKIHQKQQGGGGGASITGVGAAAAQQQPAWKKAAGTTSSGASKKAYLQWKRQRQVARQQQQQDVAEGSCSDGLAAAAGGRRDTPWGKALPAEATAPLKYAPLTGVPAAPFSTQQQQQQQQSSGGAGASIPARDSSSGTGGTALTYMPCVDPAEVGWTPEGRALGIPTRPHWKGVVSTAEQLHALEEAEFAAWQARLQEAAAATAPVASGQQQEQPEQQQQQQQQASASSGLAGGRGRLSCYEARLQYWRQLWRTVEMSDTVCVIVDARNPLLHLSDALCRHITLDHGLPLLLLLNKCDLVPAAAVAAWQAWLQAHLPGVTVVPVSAAPEHAAASARSVLEHVLQLQVERQQRRVGVQELVGLSVDELMRESVRRNTHAKRVVQEQQPQQQLPQRHSKGSAAAAAADDEEEEQEDGGSDDDWATAPNRGARKAAGRRATGRAARQQQQQQQQQRRQQQQLSGPDGVSEASRDDDESDEEESQLDEAMANLTVERRLSASAASAAAARGGGAAAAPAAAATGSCCQGGTDDAAAATAALLDRRCRPVVIGMLGEPNVGKSSTLNLLLGYHRVAVSSHPGRTKHFQTHWMCDGLLLVDCPGLVFARLGVRPAQQVLFGSSPIASCREPYAVVRYLAEASWPRLQHALKLQHPQQPPQQQQQQQQQEDEEEEAEEQDKARPAHTCGDSSSSSSAATATAAGVPSCARDGSKKDDDEALAWSPWLLCEALAIKRRWVLPRSGRLDTHRAANWLMRAALAGTQPGLGLAFLPPNGLAAAAAAADGGTATMTPATAAVGGTGV